MAYSSSGSDGIIPGNEYSFFNSNDLTTGAVTDFSSLKDMLKIVLNDYGSNVYSDKYLDFVLKNSIATIYNMLPDEALISYKKIIWTNLQSSGIIYYSNISNKYIKSIDDVFLYDNQKLYKVTKKDISNIADMSGWNEYLNPGEGNLFYYYADYTLYVFSADELPTDRCGIVCYDLTNPLSKGEIEFTYANFVLELAASHILANDGAIQNSDILFRNVLNKLKTLFEVSRYNSITEDRGEIDNGQK